MHVLALSPAAVAHAVRRFQAYGNSPSAIARHFRNRGEHARERICRMVHALESEHGIDLGALCTRFQARLEPGVTPLERGVLELLAHWTGGGRGGPELLVIHVGRVQALNALADGDLSALRDEEVQLAWALVRRTDPV